MKAPTIMAQDQGVLIELIGVTVSKLHKIKRAEEKRSYDWYLNGHNILLVWYKIELFESMSFV